MTMTYESIELAGHYDDGGTLHWDRTPRFSPILAVAGIGWREDILPVAKLIVAAGFLGWMVTTVDDSTDGCTVVLSRPDHEL